MRSWKGLFILLGIFCFHSLRAEIGSSASSSSTDTIPQTFLGKFTDDYGITYEINDSVWTQLPGVRYHILEWNRAGQYIIARNDEHNPSEPGRYTRIDYMSFEGMEPFLWGFCLSSYNASSEDEARKAIAADRTNPRKGCNGFPFSRMKKTAGK